MDAATLLSAVLHVCRDWRAVCAHDVYGPKVQLELRRVQQVLRILPECLGLWVVAAVARFGWVSTLDASGCSITDGALERDGSLQLLTSLSLRGCKNITDMGLEHVAQLTQLTGLNLSECVITDTGLEHVA